MCKLQRVFFFSFFFLGILIIWEYRVYVSKYRCMCMYICIFTHILWNASIWAKILFWYHLLVVVFLYPKHRAIFAPVTFRGEVPGNRYTMRGACRILSHDVTFLFYWRICCCFLFSTYFLLPKKKNLYSFDHSVSLRFLDGMTRFLEKQKLDWRITRQVYAILQKGEYCGPINGCKQLHPRSCRPNGAVHRLKSLRTSPSRRGKGIRRRTRRRWTIPIKSVLRPIITEGV